MNSMKNIEEAQCHTCYGHAVQHVWWSYRVDRAWWRGASVLMVVACMYVRQQAGDRWCT